MPPNGSSSRRPLKTPGGSQSSLLSGPGESPLHQDRPSPTSHATRPLAIMAVSSLLKRIQLPRGSRWIVRDPFPCFPGASSVTDASGHVYRMRMSDLSGPRDVHGRFWPSTISVRCCAARSFAVRNEADEVFCFSLSHRALDQLQYRHVSHWQRSYSSRSQLVAGYYR